MSKQAVDSVFQVLFLLTDIREILRETAPLHELDAEQKEKVNRTLANAEEQLRSIRKELVG